VTVQPQSCGALFSKISHSLAVEKNTVLSGNQSPICNMRDADPLYESGYRKKKNEKEKKNGT